MGSGKSRLQVRTSADPLKYQDVGAGSAGVPVPVTLEDEDGNPFGIKHIENKPRVSSVKYETDIAKGNIANHKAVRKFGCNTAVGATLEDVWDGSAVYVYLTSAEQLKVKSGDVDDQGNELSAGTATGGSTTTLIDTGATFQTDTVAAGDLVINDTNFQHAIVKTVDSETKITVELPMSPSNPTVTSLANASGDTYRVVNANDTGAAVIRIEGLDADYASLKEYVVLNGQTNVTTSGSFLRVFRAKVVIAGTSLKNEGNITASNNADDNVLLQISANRGQTLMALWTVPAGVTAFVESFYASTSSAKITEVDLCVRQLGEAWKIKKVILLNQGADHFPYRFEFPVRQKTDITILASASGGGGIVSAGFDLWYE